MSRWSGPCAMPLLGDEARSQLGVYGRQSSSSAENSRLERGLLPNPLIFNSRISWATRYKPGGDSALLGGDFFDAVELDDGTIRAVIGDVAGHGPDEAALGVALRVAWRALVLAEQPCDITLAALERVLQAERNDNAMFVTFATLCDIEIEPNLQGARIYLAGHPGPLLFDGESVVEAAVTRRSPPLGAVKTPPAWAPNVIDLGTEWTMVAFTDGIVEGRAGRGRARLDTDGLIILAEKAFREADTLAAVANRLVSAAEDANGAPLGDDVALVVLSTAPRWRK